MGLHVEDLCYNKTVFHCVPKDARHILEIGCATGDLGAALKMQNPSCTVTAVEINKDVALQARSRLDQVYIADAESFDFRQCSETFDVVIFADSLEHMKDPRALLDRIFVSVAHRAQFVFCIPNVRNLYIIDQLLHGDWDYTPWGLLDATHYHLFSLKSFRRLLEQKEMLIQQWYHLIKPLDWYEKMAAPKSLSETFSSYYSYLLSCLQHRKDLGLVFLREHYPGYSFQEEDLQDVLSAQFVFSVLKSDSQPR